MILFSVIVLKVSKAWGFDGTFHFSGTVHGGRKNDEGVTDDELDADVSAADRRVYVF